jgi:hypothetical protein
MLLYRNTHDITGVLVAGDVKVRNHEVLNADWAELQAHTHEAARRLWAAA